MEKKSRFYVDYRYLLIAFFWSLVVFAFTAPQALDITRYYSTIYTYNGTVLDFLIESFNRNYDFIYVVSLKIAYDIGIPLDVITSIYVSLFLIFSLKIAEVIMNKVGVQRIPDLIVFSANVIAPFIWFISISRSTAAFCFFFYAVLKCSQKNIKSAIVFFSFSVLTHISMVIFIALYILGMFLSPFIKRISSHRMVLIIGISAVLIVYLESFFTEFFKLLSELDVEGSRYSIYYSDFEGGFSTNFLLNPQLPKSQRLHLVLLLILNVLLLLMDKKKDLFDSVLIIAEILLIFFTFSIPHMVYRMVLFMLPFMVVPLCRIYCLSPKKRNTIILFVFIFTLFQLFGFYNERLSFL